MDDPIATKAEAWTMMLCLLAARRKRLTQRQVDWLMEMRERADYFLAAHYG